MVKPMSLTNQYPSLKYKIVLITGGASGIGASLVETFCHQGAQVCFIDIRDEDAHKLVEQLSHRADNIPPRYYRCNLLNIPRLQATIKQIYNDVGPINILVNNAANDTRHDFRSVTVDYWNERLAVNLRHHFFAAQAVYEHMLELGGGSIINLGSMSWYATQGGMPGKNILENQCLKKSVMPEDISAMALFLASDDSRLCTAQHFIVDGGWI